MIFPFELPVPLIEKNIFLVVTSYQPSQLLMSTDGPLNRNIRTCSRLWVVPHFPSGIGWFSNRTGTSVDDGARKSNNWLDQWQSGRAASWRSRPVAKSASSESRARVIITPCQKNRALAFRSLLVYYPWGLIPLSRNFYLRTCVKFTFANKIQRHCVKGRT